MMSACFLVLATILSAYHPIVQQINGEDMVCFDVAESRKLVFLSEKLKISQKLMDDQRLLLSEKDSALILKQDAIVNLLKETEDLRTRLNDAERRMSSPLWPYKQIISSFAVGAALGSAAVLIIRR